ncbi:Na_H_Exchanger domain-containing protein [Psidium guajava]|nr:Na_H_Exchanger domain-containing protein [Psidium guajava]
MAAEESTHKSTFTLNGLRNSQKISLLLLRELGIATLHCAVFTMKMGWLTFDLVHFNTLAIDRRILRR